MHTRSMRPSASAAYNQRFRWMLDHAPAVSVLARFRTMSPAARSVLEFRGARVAGNDLRNLRDGSGFMAMLDKDDHKSPCGRERGRQRKVTDAGLSIHGKRAPKGEGCGGSRAVLLDQRGVPLTIDGRFIADGWNDGYGPTCAKSPWVTKSGIVARACPAAENPYGPEMWAFVRWRGPKPPAVAAGIVNRASARNTLVTNSMDLGAFAVNPSTQCPSQKSGNLRFLGFSAEPFLTSDV
jgi:hypothetical protein